MAVPARVSCLHEAFATPGLIRTQIAILPDGAAFFCIARTVEKPGGRYRAPATHQVGRARLRPDACGRTRLCRRARPRPARRRDRDRHRMPPVRAQRLPPARLSAAAAPPGDRRDGARPLCLRIPPAPLSYPRERSVGETPGRNAARRRPYPRRGHEASTESAVSIRLLSGS